ncbi:MAG TPA: adenylate/guanylate cyclase domain-containing protein, partial [Flavobacteriales bacterium]|nr:adenylate/guanylate cyclase domain-containing protein [Flavobacteriales bacterium]
MRALARSWIVVLATSLSLAGGRLCAQDRIRMRACVDSCSKAMSAGAIDRAKEQVEEAMEIAQGLNDSIAIAEVLVKQGNIRMMQGDYNSSLLDLQRALSIYEAAQHLDGMATVFTSIGSIHFYDRNYERAQQYYLKGLAIREQLGKTSDIATLIGNLGSVMEEMGRPDSALAYHRRHLAMRRAAGQQNWLPICYTNLGVCFDKMGQSDSALHYLETSVGMYPKTDRQSHALSHAMTMLGVARLNAGQHHAAVEECQQALTLAEELGDLPMLERGCYCLYRAYLALGNTSKALYMHQRYIAARDSMSGEQRAKELLRLELNYHFERELLADSLRRVDEKRQAEFAYQQRLTKERDQKRFFLFGAIGVLLLAGGLWSRLRYMRRSRSIIQKERDRSESLLLNILPKPIADELKANGRATARDVEGVSILFTDFHDFTRMSERLSAHELVEEIDACFRAFDGITAKYRLEKIKTIGDAYMCAGGLPEPRAGSVRDTVLAALDMQAWLEDRAAGRAALGLPFFTMRAGIHTGPVVAGIVGDSKFQYDIWGDTVNTAAHMESAGAVGEVNISEATFEFVKDSADLVFSPRG